MDWHVLYCSKDNIDLILVPGTSYGRYIGIYSLIHSLTHSPLRTTEPQVEVLLSSGLALRRVGCSLWRSVQRVTVPGREKLMRGMGRKSAKVTG